MALFLGIMTILTFSQVVLRYVFGTGFVWSLEATTYSFAWLVLIGMSYGVRTRSHLAVTLLTNRLSPAGQRCVALVAVALSIVYAGLMVYGASVFLDRLFGLAHEARDIPLPRWLLTSILPIAFVLLLVRFVQVGWQVFKGRDTALGSGEGDLSAAALDEQQSDEPPKR